MRPPHTGYPARWPMVTAVVATVVVAVIAWTRPVSAASVLTGWAACYCIPVALIVWRRVRLREVIRVAGSLAICGLPLAGLYALLGFVAGGEVGLVGGFLLAMLMGGWGALFAAAFPENRVVAASSWISGH